MVIHQFNKLIRNKWVWGAFAIAISAFFAFDFLIADLDRAPDERAGDGAGTLGGKAVKGVEFNTVAEDIRGFGQNRDWKRKTSEVNRAAWETLAALAIAEENGIVATDAEVREAIRHDRSFAPNGTFSFAAYQRLLRENGIAPERFEAFLKRRLTMMRIGETMLEAASWVSPMEIARSVADMTDVYTVRTVPVKQTKAESDAIKLDDAGLRKWYDANTNSLALPERVRIRMVRYDATATNVLAKMTVTEDEMRDHYDATVDRYTSTDTNGVEKVRPFEEVKGEIERELRVIAAVQCFETNLNERAYASKAAKGSSRLDEIAREDGKKVETSEWFSLEGGYAEGFMTSAYAVAPGAKNLIETVAELDASSEDLRYGVVLSDKAVWLVERLKSSPAHVPTFDEAKGVIGDRALRDARADALKAKAAALAAKGTNAVLAVAGASTNITFAICDIARGQIPNQSQVVQAARKLKAGEISEFAPTGADEGLLVVCVERKAGDPARADELKAQMRDSLAMIQRRELPADWQKWNLETIGFEPADFATVEEQDGETEE